MVANIFHRHTLHPGGGVKRSNSLHTPGTPGVGSKGHLVFFSKSGHVAYQIKVEEM